VGIVVTGVGKLGEFSYLCRCAVGQVQDDITQLTNREHGAIRAIRTWHHCGEADNDHADLRDDAGSGRWAEDDAPQQAEPLSRMCGYIVPVYGMERQMEGQCSAHTARRTRTEIELVAGMLP
jgi:hypothetical protein